MVNFCCVIGCSHRSNGDKDVRFFKIPSVHKKTEKDLANLIARQRREWLRQIYRKEISENTTKPWHRVCSSHFVSGKPAKPTECTDPDWAPTINLGHWFGKKPRVNTHQRLKNRNQRMREAGQHQLKSGAVPTSCFHRTTATQPPGRQICNMATSKQCTEMEENIEDPIAIHSDLIRKDCVVLSDKSLVQQWMFVGIKEKLVEDSDIAQFLLSLYFGNETQKPAVECVVCHSDLLPVWKCPNCFRHYAFDPTRPQNGSGEEATEGAGGRLQSPVLQSDSVNLSRSFRPPVLDSNGVVADVNQINLLHVFDQENITEPQSRRSLILGQKKGKDNVFSLDSATCVSDAEETRLHSSAPKLTSRCPIVFPLSTVVKSIGDQNEPLLCSVADPSQVIGGQTVAMTNSSDQPKNKVIGLVLPPSVTASPGQFKSSRVEFLTKDRILPYVCHREKSQTESKSCSINPQSVRWGQAHPDLGQSILTPSGQTTGFLMNINSKGDQALSQTVARDRCSNSAVSPNTKGCTKRVLLPPNTVLSPNFLSSPNVVVLPKEDINKSPPLSSKLFAALKMICQYSIDNQKVPKGCVNFKMDENGDQSMKLADCQKKKVLVRVVLPPNKKLPQNLVTPPNVTLLMCSTPLAQEIATDSPVGCLSVNITSASNTTEVTGDGDTPSGVGQHQLEEKEGTFADENESSSHPDHPVENQCVFCRRIYSSRNSLRRHLSSTHNKKTKYVCEICSKVFLSYNGLLVHKYSHGDKRRYLCHVCGKDFMTSRNLRGHSFIHLDHRPYKCKECVKCFKKPENLQSHMLTHTGEKKFICEVCGKAFAWAANMRSHQKLHKNVNYCPY